MSRKEALNKALGRAADGRLSRSLDEHTFHSFPARMPLRVAQILVEELTDQASTVLDPMCGSGTTTLAAASLGRKSFGFDLDPLAVLIASSAVSKLPAALLGKVGIEALAEAKNIYRRATTLSQITEFSSETKQFIQYWFPRKSQLQLAALAKAINQFYGEKKRFLWALFSSIIVVKSAGPSYALDLARSRPHRDLFKDVVYPFDVWEARLQRAIKRKSRITPINESTIRVGDSRHLPFRNNAVDLVLTSPPYLHAIDYIRAHKFALVWMGRQDLEDLRHLRSALIGTEKGMFHRDGLPSKMEAKLQTAQRSSPARTRRYLSDLFRSLKEAHRVLRPGAIAVFVMGDSILSISRADAGSIMRDLGFAAGFSDCSIEFRTLSNRRRSLPPPQWSQNDLAKRMQRECFLGFLKE